MAANPNRSRKNRLRRIPGFAMDDPGFDKLIHEPLRLGIMSMLAVNDALTFVELKEMLETTDGNLSVQARKLEDAGYAKCKKTFQGRTPRTEFRLTGKGRKAFTCYLDHMQALIRVARRG